MPDYDFHQLSPYDLEILARDLLQAHWGETLESFKTGRDGASIYVTRLARREEGYALRRRGRSTYAHGPDETIVQVKHYLRTGLKGLLRNLKLEVIKVRRLQPRRYATRHVSSSVACRQGRDSNRHRRGRPQSKRCVGRGRPQQPARSTPRHRRPALQAVACSRTILDRVIHNAAVTRSEFKAKQVYEQAKRFVASDAYPAAVKMLEEERVAIIAGPPGVGKTTLADLLLYAHLEKGYQAVLIQRDITEGEAAFSGWRAADLLLR